MYGNHVLTFLYRTCRLSSIWMENGAHFGRFATKAWRISIKRRWFTRGLVIRRSAKGGRAGGPRFPGIRSFPISAVFCFLAVLVEFQDFCVFCDFRQISRISMFSAKIQLPPPPAPEPLINVTVSWCFRGAPFCETNIFVKIAVFGEIRRFSWKSVIFTGNHDFHANDDFAGNGTAETSINL